MPYTPPKRDQAPAMDFESILNAMPGNVLVLKPDAPHFTVVAVSDDMLSSTNMKRESVTGRSIFELYPENPEAVNATGPSTLRRSLNNVLELKKPDQMPFVRYDTLNAAGIFEERYWSLQTKPILGNSGEVLYLLHTTTEVLAPRQPEENKDELNKMANAMPQVVWIAEADGEVTYYNERIAEFAGARKLGNGTWSWEGILHQEDVEPTAHAWWRAVEEGNVYEKEHRLKMQDGTYRWHLSRAFPQRNKAGVIEKWYGTATDVHNQKANVEALRQSEARLQAIIDATPECIKIVSPDGTLHHMNSSGLDMIEAGREVIGYASVFDVVAPEHKSNWIKNHQLVCKGESISWEFDVIGLKGTRRSMETHAVPLPGPDGMMHLAVTRDVTERKKSEVALKESEEQFRVFANNIHNLAWMAEPDGWIFWYNERWYEYTGTTLEEMMGWGWEKVHHPDHVERVVAFAREAWSKGENWELTFPLKGVDGNYCWFLTRANAVKDANGNVIRWIGTNTNIDDQKKAEAALEFKNVELTRINNDLDNFIYTASHDLKAPIANIEGLLVLLADDLAQGKENNEVKHILNLMQGAVNRFKKTIDSLTDVVKLQQENSSEAVMVSLPEVFDEVIQDLEPMIISSGAKLESDLKDCPAVRFSEKNMRSLVHNLISNAIKYRSPDRTPQVNISCQSTEEYHVLTIKDNGLGMKASSRGQLFTMFKRFHDHVEGSGIGLYMVKKMVENAGGFIEVESQENIGTTFKVYFKR